MAQQQQTSGVADGIQPSAPEAGAGASSNLSIRIDDDDAALSDTGKSTCSSQHTLSSPNPSDDGATITADGAGILTAYTLNVSDLILFL
jgi:hypothetical protein